MHSLHCLVRNNDPRLSKDTNSNNSDPWKYKEIRMTLTPDKNLGDGPYMVEIRIVD